MKLLQTLLLGLLFIECYSQPRGKDRKPVSIFIGAKTRVTPIYLRPVPGAIRIWRIDALEQPDKHLSGPGFLLSEKKEGQKFSVSLQQVIRYDYIYQKIPFADPPADFNYEIRQKIIIDLYGEIGKTVPLRKSSLDFYIGAAVCGLNSGYVETRRVFQTQTMYTDYQKKKNFIFPAITTGAGWQKNRFLAGLKFGWCWHNPTLYHTPFIFPEISLQYQLFQL